MSYPYTELSTGWTPRACMKLTLAKELGKSHWHGRLLIPEKAPPIMMKLHNIFHPWKSLKKKAKFTGMLKMNASRMIGPSTSSNWKPAYLRKFYDWVVFSHVLLPSCIAKSTFIPLQRSVRYLEESRKKCLASRLAPRGHSFLRERPAQWWPNHYQMRLPFYMRGVRWQTRYWCLVHDHRFGQNDAHQAEPTSKIRTG